MEETGLEIEVLKPAFCSTSFFHPNYSEKNKDKYWNCPLIYFLVRKIGGKISTEYFDEEERQYARKAEWIDLDNIHNLKFYNSVDSLKIIKEALEQCP